MFAAFRRLFLISALTLMFGGMGVFILRSLSLLQKYAPLQHALYQKKDLEFERINNLNKLSPSLPENKILPVLDLYPDKMGTWYFFSATCVPPQLQEKMFVLLSAQEIQQKLSGESCIPLKYEDILKTLHPPFALYVHAQHDTPLHQIVHLTESPHSQ